MGRWEPNARQRLAEAALDLFAERGYDQTTVAEIAERAGLTKRTFFRYFADKREVLFGGQEELARLFSEGIAATPADATPFEAVGGALDAVAAIFTGERLAQARARQAVVAANSELLERELLKRAKMVQAMHDALAAHGISEPTARVAAELGCLAFGTTFFRWVDAGNRREFGALAAEALDELRTATAALG
ncbi:TetR family transcriptional regulator [Amycolatopsis echigonensis]|uniref:TetR family transcriptional regulator n=1 Tax=Amycolatopsis echigonensis TaxID=2576905 RepID=A0A8E1W0V5_9PSEU|nr:TetR/AcrR family transcriptional regulator [Amycolatopsis echigonensis]MBB2502073.1 TetR family transcriptional regulator [Amycolatopsis echigonensis]